MNHGKSGEVECSYADEMYGLHHCLVQMKTENGQLEDIASSQESLCWAASKKKQLQSYWCVFSPWDTRHPLELREKKWETGDYRSRVAEGHSECRAGFCYSYCACCLLAAQHWSKAGSHPVKA